MKTKGILLIACLVLLLHDVSSCSDSEGVRDERPIKTRKKTGKNSSKSRQSSKARQSSSPSTGTAATNQPIDYKWYCGESTTCGTVKHCMCTQKQTWGPKCVDPKMHTMTKARKMMFLDESNKYRSNLAMGKLMNDKEKDGKFWKEKSVFYGKPADDMGEMIWDDELEMIAQMVLTSCIFDHTKCHRTPFLIRAGQNLAFKRSSDVLTPEDAIMSAIRGWWREHNNITYIGRDLKYDENEIKSTYIYGHFTEMAGNQANRMGCAVMSTFNEKVFLTACNYGNSNIISLPIYNIGPPGSKCKTKSKYNGLCGPEEDYSHYTIFHTTDKKESEPVKQWRANGRMLDFLHKQVPKEKRIKPSADHQPLKPITTTINRKMICDPTDKECVKNANRKRKAQLKIDLKDYLETKVNNPPRLTLELDNKMVTFASPTHLKNWLNNDDMNF